MLSCLLGSLIVSGYVVPHHKLLQRWQRDGVRPDVVLPAVLPVRADGQVGELYLNPVDSYALAVGGTPWASSTEASTGAAYSALWSALDLLLQPSEDAAVAALLGAGVDLERTGFARDSCSADGVVHTLGARGEGEPDLAQVWFARKPLRPCRLQLAEGARVEVGPVAAHGWPEWFRLGSGQVVEVTGPSTPAMVKPLWAAPGAPLVLPADDPLDNWRRAFDGRDP